jgi:hypothetical protein
MLAGILMAKDLGYKVGIVTNSYWATSEEDTLLWLAPLVGKIEDLTISSDLFHFSEKISQQSRWVKNVANILNIPLGIICIEQPDSTVVSSYGQIPPESSMIMYRGRAAEKLAHKAIFHSSSSFTRCPHEDLKDPGRVHIDPFGNIHLCQGISIGNINHLSIKDICNDYNPIHHPIIGPLLEGGPFRLAEKYNLPVNNAYADACHLCYEARIMLRKQFPEMLLPDQMYGIAQ